MEAKMHNLTARTSQSFWLKEALQKAELILAEGVIPLPDDHHLENFLVEEVNEKIEKQTDEQPEMEQIRQYSIISEALICDLINQGLVFGPGARAFKSNQYDDYINHVDLVVELAGCKAPYIAIDVTYATFGIDKKVRRIKNRIVDGNLSTLTYSLGEARNKIPTLLLGFELFNLCQLGKLWVRNPEQVATSPLIELLKSQIDEQLEAYENCANSLGQHDVAEIFQKLIRHYNTLIGSRSFAQKTKRRDKISELIISGVL